MPTSSIALRKRHLDLNIRPSLLDLIHPLKQLSDLLRLSRLAAADKFQQNNQQQTPCEPDWNRKNDFLMRLSNTEAGCIGKANAEDFHCLNLLGVAREW